MSEMIDRVARALKDQAGEDHALPSWAVMARAAIEAMREPTPNMISAGANACRFQSDWPETAVANAWPDMIEAALKA